MNKVHLSVLRLRVFVACATIGLGVTSICSGKELDLSRWEKQPPELQSADVLDGQATFSSEKWAYLVSPDEYADAEISARITIEKAADQFGFFGQSWSVWPDLTYGDQGFEAALLLRSGKCKQPPGEQGYRVQFSHRYQHVALVKFPDGGYLASVPCEIKLNQPLRVELQLQGSRISVAVDGQQKIAYHDRLLPIEKGRIGIGVSSRAKVGFTDVDIKLLARIPNDDEPLAAHQPRFHAEKWLGDRPWVFDGDEPIMLLPTPAERYINNVKLRPGFKPLLSWNSHWGIENQGAFPDGENKSSDIAVSGGGKSLTIAWTGKQKDGRFATKSSMEIGFDAFRGMYTYDIDSELEVLGKEPFHFRYGYDFEHHTPLDPFRWQYLLVRRDEGQLTYRPLSPFDPGGMENVQQYHGARVWFGRHSEDFQFAPAVEYEINPEWQRVADEKGNFVQRKLNTAVCAAFYDTGVSFHPETAAPGTKVRVKFRYTGYATDAARSMFAAAKVDDNPRNDPTRYFIFARDQWPSIRFDDFLGLDKPWWGGAPFMSGHNARPIYELVKLDQPLSIPSADAKNVPPATHAMKLGPQSYGIASLAAPRPLEAGKYIVTATVKSVNAHGPGGRIEIVATENRDINGFTRMSGKVLREETHYLGNGSFDWQQIGFVTEVPGDAPALALGLGNSGTGDVYVADVSFRRLADGEPLPQGVLAAARHEPPKSESSLAGALFDFRMLEQADHFVYNDGTGSARTLELCNAEWVVEDGHPAIKFSGGPDETKQRESIADQPRQFEKANFARGGNLEFTYLRHPSTQHGKSASFALAGNHGGGQEYSAFSLSTWIKPDDRMQPAYWGTDILGFGARRVKLILRGDKPPYELGASLNFADYLMCDVKLDAGRWYHLALTGAQTDDHKWLVRLYVDGKQVLESKSEKIAAPMSMPESLILGCELFYLNSAFYHGLIGRTLVLDRVLTAAEIAELSR